MTQANREKLYNHMRFLQNNYEAREGLNSGPTATASVRAKSKETADAILLKYPELGKEQPTTEELPKPTNLVEQTNPTKSTVKKRGKK